MRACWRRALHETRERGRGVLVQPESGYFIATSFSGCKCPPEDQAVINREMRGKNGWCVRLSRQDEFDVPLRTGWRVWAREFQEDICRHNLDAEVFVDVDRLCRTMVTQAKQQGFQSGRCGTHEVVRWHAWTHPLELPRQLVIMVYEARRIEEQALVFVNALADRFSTYERMTAKLAEAFPDCRVVVQDQYLVVQRRPWEKGIAKSYWSIPENPEEFGVVLAKWVSEVSTLLRALPLDRLPPGTMPEDPADVDTLIRMFGRHSDGSPGERPDQRNHYETQKGLR